MHNRANTIPLNQAGLSLIELMVAITLSMILMLGAVQIFLTNKNTYINNNELSEIQENGRFALSILTKDIRSVGYKGQCLNNPVNHIKNNDSELWSLSDGPLLGWAKNSRPNFIPSNISSEGIFIQFAAGNHSDFVGASTNTTANSILNWNGTTTTSPLKQGDTALISDGLGCDIFHNNSNNNNHIEKNNAKNRPWSHEYTENFEVLGLQSIAYYIADDQGTPSLFRSIYDYDLNQINGETYALVSGVEEIKFEYGIGQGLDLNQAIVTEYVSADNVTNWSTVFAIKLTITLKANSGMKKDFSTLIGLRNQLP